MVVILAVGWVPADVRCGGCPIVQNRYQVDAATQIVPPQTNKLRTPAGWVV